MLFVIYCTQIFCEQSKCVDKMHFQGNAILFHLIVFNNKIYQGLISYLLPKNLLTTFMWTVHA